MKTHEGRDGLFSFEQPHTSQHSGQLKGVKCKVARRHFGLAVEGEIMVPLPMSKLE